VLRSLRFSIDRGSRHRQSAATPGKGSCGSDQSRPSSGASDDRQYKQKLPEHLQPMRRPALRSVTVPSLPIGRSHRRTSPQKIVVRVARHRPVLNQDGPGVTVHWIHQFRSQILLVPIHPNGEEETQDCLGSPTLYGKFSRIKHSTVNVVLSTLHQLTTDPKPLQGRLSNALSTPLVFENKVESSTAL